MESTTWVNSKNVYISSELTTYLSNGAVPCKPATAITATSSTFDYHSGSGLKSIGALHEK